MAKIPGVPTLDPVSKPQMSPGEAGKPGQAIAQLGAEVNDVADTGLQFDIFLKKAQEHVDSLAAQNEAAKIYADTQNTLDKTQNSRDVAGVIQDANKSLNDLSARWASSPAAIAIQQSADALRPDLSHRGTVRQVDLMGKEFKVTIAQQAETLSGSYAADRGAGGSGDMALGAFATAVHGGVTTGLIGDVEAQEMVRQFKQQGQELQVNNGISNANPDVNQKTYDSLNKENYPDLTQEKLDILKGQALDAFKSHTTFQKWAEVQMAMKTLPAQVQQFTNPGTGRFDEASALKYNADRMAKGEITEDQANALAQGFESHAAQLRVGVKQEADKRLNAVDNLLTQHKFGEAARLMSHDEGWFEENGMGAEYREGMRYRNSMLSQTRAEYNQERSMGIAERQEKEREAAYESDQAYGKIRLEIASGKVYEPLDIWKMPGLSDKDRTTLLQEVKPENRDPHVTDGLNKISNLGITDERKYELARVFINQVKAGDARGSAITETADKLIKEVKSKNAQEYIDQLYRQTTEGRQPSTSADAWKQFTRKQSQTGGIRVQQTSSGKTRYSTDGGTTWHLGSPPQQ